MDQRGNETEAGKHHLIVGAGVMGHYLGACLSMAGLSVTLLGKQRFFARTAHPLTLVNERNEVSPSSDTKRITDVSQLEGIPDVVWLCMKCPDVTHGLQQIKPLLGKHTLVIGCQNGIGAQELMADMLPEHNVFSAVFTINAVIDQYRRLHKTTEGHLAVEQALAALLKPMASWSRWLPITVTTDIYAYRWAKLQLNLANAVNALADMPLKTMLMQRHDRCQIADMMDELLAITDSLELQLPRLTPLPPSLLPTVLKLPTGIFKFAASNMLQIHDDAKLSMWWDLHQQKVTEIDFLQGAIVKQGALLGIQVPHCQHVWQQVKALEHEAHNVTSR